MQGEGFIGCSFTYYIIIIILQYAFDWSTVTKSTDDELINKYK